MNKNTHFGNQRSFSKKIFVKALGDVRDRNYKSCKYQHFKFSEEFEKKKKEIRKIMVEKKNHTIITTRLKIHPQRQLLDDLRFELMFSFCFSQSVKYAKNFQICKRIEQSETCFKNQNENHDKR